MLLELKDHELAAAAEYNKAWRPRTVVRVAGLTSLALTFANWLCLAAGHVLFGTGAFVRAITKANLLVSLPLWTLSFFAAGYYRRKNVATVDAVSKSRRVIRAEQCAALLLGLVIIPVAATELAIECFSPPNETDSNQHLLLMGLSMLGGGAVLILALLVGLPTFLFLACMHAAQPSNFELSRLAREEIYTPPPPSLSSLCTTSEPCLWSLLGGTDYEGRQGDWTEEAEAHPLLEQAVAPSNLNSVGCN
jgi:hypothetical protein